LVAAARQIRNAEQTPQQFADVASTGSWRPLAAAASFADCERLVDPQDVD
jgi:hypothetical protein